MNPIQMLAVLLILSVIVQVYLAEIGVDMTFLQVLAGLAVLKGVALFLVPEKAPIVLVKSRTTTEEETD